MTPPSDIVAELSWRGLIQDLSDEGALRALPRGTTFYFGVDPSAASLHLGNLSSMMTVFHLARCGLKPIMLFGGATGFIGDPRETSERSLLSREQVQANIASITKQVKAIFARAGIEATYVDNYDWTHDVSVLEFLREVGKHFTVNYMTAKDVVKTRLEGEGISYTEFSYMLLQAFDFLYLYRNHDCKLQVGGSDQWGNITAGLELIRRKIQGQAYALSSPLMLDSNGKKIGKTEGVPLWLDGAIFSPFKMHQFLLNLPDAEVIKLVRRFTFLTESEVKELEEKQQLAPQKREAQRTLADSVVKLLHGDEAVTRANRSASVLFGESIDGLSDEDLLEIFSAVPSIEVGKEALASQTAAELFVGAGLVKSKGEARRLIESGGAYVNSHRITDAMTTAQTLTNQGSKLLVLRAGKKNYALVKRYP